ncbi:hypothetical protein NECAME_14451 [Necator americanus]|uniref:Uncharacterized protein n=1 Tax=Necator americanus TaxID=51031 RepID=W2SQG8_NECAM|nr:hypothetical protein NECAME_14451 [Necator americanus]ETN70937.1 hypothetical protein NECAME_14451 [Necator americanus]
MMRAKKIKYDVIGLIETRRPHPLNAVYETGEELFSGTCESRGVGGVGFLVNTSIAKDIHSFEQLTARIGHLRMRRCGQISDRPWELVIPEAFLSRLESPGGGYHNEIDHIIVSKRFCLTDVVVVSKIYAGSDHRLLRGRFSFTRKEEKVVKFREQNLRATINWDLFAMLADFWEDSVIDKIDKEYDRLVEHLHDFTNKAEFQNYQKTLNVDKLIFIQFPLHYYSIINRKKVLILMAATWIVLGYISFTLEKDPLGISEALPFP